MSIGLDEVLHVAKLAELAVKENRVLRRLVDQMNRIVNYVATLDEVPRRPDRGAVPGRTAVGSAARGCGSAVPLARPPAAMAPEFVEWVLPGAPPRRDGGSVTAGTAGQRGSGAATVAAETGERA